MKRFRPYCSGYIVLYVLALLSLADAVFTGVRQARGINDMLTSMSFFAYVVFAMAVAYTWFYARAKVVVDGTKLRVAFPINARPKEGDPRAMFLFRQGEFDLKFVDKTLDMKKLVSYGYVEDMGYAPLDQSNTGGKLFPIHEVAMITSENKRYHMNAGVYSARQRREIFSLIRERSGVEPTGSLAEEIK